MTEPISPECRKLLSDISAYLDGDLDAAQCDEIERHCADCASCTAVIGSLRQTVGLCRGAAAAPLPDPVRARARESIRRLLDAGK